MPIILVVSAYNNSMTSQIHTNPSCRIVSTAPNCLRADFYQPGANPYFSVAAADDRGAFYGLEYAAARPFLVEILHTNAGAVRGNHVHRHCTEIFTVLSGDLDMYLLCDCPEKHLYKKRMNAGTTVAIHPGTAHAIHARTPNESVATFGDNDPRDDRERVELIGI